MAPLELRELHRRAELNPWLEPLYEALYHYGAFDEPTLVRLFAITQLRLVGWFRWSRRDQDDLKATLERLPHRMGAEHAVPGAVATTLSGFWDMCADWAQAAAQPVYHASEATLEVGQRIYDALQRRLSRRAPGGQTWHSQTSHSLSELRRLGYRQAAVYGQQYALGGLEGRAF
ncbi:hypothetical protein JCM10207_002113 [Rhodosporidiobolus poonsookiae]